MKGKLDNRALFVDDLVRVAGAMTDSNDNIIPDVGPPSIDLTGIT
ncbi:MULTISPECIES: hypothetical protein [Bradyrhizobium]|nr:hypothetical protein [Bradyrhizobium pachyrhizi]